MRIPATACICGPSSPPHGTKCHWSSCAQGILLQQASSLLSHTCHQYRPTRLQLRFLITDTPLFLDCSDCLNSISAVIDGEPRCCCDVVAVVETMSRVGSCTVPSTDGKQLAAGTAIFLLHHRRGSLNLYLELLSRPSLDGSNGASRRVAPSGIGTCPPFALIEPLRRSCLVLLFQPCPGPQIPSATLPSWSFTITVRMDLAQSSHDFHCVPRVQYLTTERESARSSRSLPACTASHFMRKYSASQQSCNHDAGRTWASELSGDE